MEGSDRILLRWFVSEGLMEMKDRATQISWGKAFLSVGTV
jgi:hypothetical protein